MELEWYKNILGDRIFKLTISDADYQKLILSEHDRFMLDNLDRKDASIEERLMALQIIARRVEENA